MNIQRIFAGALIASALALPGPTAAQIAPPRYVGGPTFEVGLTHPLLTGDMGDWGAFSGVLGGRLSLRGGSGATWFAETRLAHATYGEESSTTLGNLVLGMVLSTSDALEGVFAVTLPTATEWGDDDFATGYGFFADPEHVEHFTDQGWSLDAGLTGRRHTPAGVTYGVRVAGQFLVPTEEDMDTQVMAGSRLAHRRQDPVRRRDLRVRHAQRGRSLLRRAYVPSGHGLGGPGRGLGCAGVLRPGPGGR